MHTTDTCDTMRNKNTNSTLFLEALLGILSAFGPFVMNTYLAGLPQIAEYYSAQPAAVQLSLATCTVGLAIGQFVFGTVSDSFGRKTPLLISLGIFVLASWACIYAPTVELFVAVRFFQGLAAAGGVVISRSIAADCYTGSALARMFGAIGMINGVSTVASPMVGGFFIGALGWKAVFWLLMALGGVMIAMSLFLCESHPREKRVKFSPAMFVSGVRKVLGNRRFTKATLQYGLVMAMIFINLASTPFIMDGYGMGADWISLVFGVNSIALGVAGAAASRFADMRKVIHYSNPGMLLTSACVAVTLVADMGFWAYEWASFVQCLFVGALVTATTTVAMDAEKANAGTASAIFGAVGFAVGGIFSPLVGIGPIAVTTSVLFIAVSALGCLSVRTRQLAVSGHD